MLKLDSIPFRRVQVSGAATYVRSLWLGASSIIIFFHCTSNFPAFFSSLSLRVPVTLLLLLLNWRINLDFSSRLLSPGFTTVNQPSLICLVLCLRQSPVTTMSSPVTRHNQVFADCTHKTSIFSFSPTRQIHLQHSPCHTLLTTHSLKSYTWTKCTYMILTGRRFVSSLISRFLNHTSGRFVQFVSSPEFSNPKNDN